MRNRQWKSNTQIDSKLEEHQQTPADWRAESAILQTCQSLGKSLIKIREGAEIRADQTNAFKAQIRQQIELGWSS